jgi:hypothetical protein
MRVGRRTADDGKTQEVHVGHPTDRGNRSSSPRAKSAKLTASAALNLDLNERHARFGRVGGPYGGQVGFKAAFSTFPDEQGSLAATLASAHSWR